MFTIILYILAIISLGISFYKDRGKTNMALKKAWKAFENILPQFLSILIVIGLALAILSPQTITSLLAQILLKIPLDPGVKCFRCQSRLQVNAQLHGEFPFRFVRRLAAQHENDRPGNARMGKQHFTKLAGQLFPMFP